MYSPGLSGLPEEAGFAGIYGIITYFTMTLDFWKKQHIH